MITLVKKIPAKFERTVLEEYYKFFQNQNGERDILNKNLKFTMDKEKLTDKELHNKSFMDSRKTLENEHNDFTFLIVFNAEDRIQSVARIYITKEYIHICDIVYTNYPDAAEKLQLLNEIVQKVEEIASLNEQEIVFEIPTNEKIATRFATTCGYRHMAGDKDTYRTELFIKHIEKRKINEQTLNRKQRKESN